MYTAKASLNPIGIFIQADYWVTLGDSHELTRI
ncbi:MAG: hypothetical protein ACI9YL_001120 [Luteibaculaceae bacterium]|jgi:hypothetical protein